MSIFMFMKSTLAVLGISLTIAPGSSLLQSQELHIDAASSKMMVNVGRTGILAFAGHDHEVAVPAITGSVMLDRTDVSRSKL